jgi:predicted flap endonuclease-1-like 5' DNA nuclease
MNIAKIEGIGKQYARTLAKAGVKTTAGLLKKGASAKGRKELARATGISGKLILEWVNLADLMRVKGIGEEYSDLLEEAGVDTVKELRTRKAGALSQAIAATNKKKKLVRRTPGMKTVERWVAEAKKLKPMVEY